MTDGDPRALWDPLADWWKQTFTGGADPEYELQILPLVAAQLAGSQRVLDLGCGEGQVARALLAAGSAAHVVGIDPSRAQLANAVAHGGEAGAAEQPLPRPAGSPARPASPAGPAGHAGPRYLQGRGEMLPFADASFDGVVCCLAIEHAGDVDAVLGEVARVLEPGGQFLLLVNHPMFQGTGSGFIDDRILGERYWRVGPYLVEDVSWEHVDAGVELPFAHRPLSRYVNPLADVDVLLVHMEEPAPHPDFLATSLDPQLEGAIPRLLALRFELRPRPVPTSPRRRGATRRGRSASTRQDGGTETYGAALSGRGGRRWPST